MSQARMSTGPNKEGKYKVTCEPCDAEGYFPTQAMAIQAKKAHICHGEAMSAQEY